MNKTVSIIIPVYNAEKYLEKCINSVINQTYKKLEIICINDCSIDNSLNILEEFSKNDNRIRIIYNEENIGAAISRNVGINNAAGEYIYFLDADDYIDQNYLESMIQKIEKESCDIVLNLSIINESNGITTLYKHPSMPDINTDGEYLDKITTIHDAPCFIWARMYRKTFLDKNNLRFIDTYIDDVAFNTISTIFTDKTFVFYGAKYHYVIHNSGMVGQTEASNTKDLNHIKAHSLIYDFLKERGRLDDKLKLFRVYPFMKVDTEEKFDFYKKFFEKIEENFEINENIYNEMEKYFAESILKSANYDEYLQNYNKIVTIGYLRKSKCKI